MSDGNADQDSAGSTPLPRRRRTGCLVLLGIALVLVVGGIIAWQSRVRLADDFVQSQLRNLGLSADYTIDRIGTGTQVFSHVVVGDKAHPDLTIERLEVTIEPRIGLPGIGKIRLVRPRLYGTYHDGKLSFGALDKVLFEQPSTTPFEFPDMDLTVEDGRALLATDYGNIGLKAEGSGNLRGGFAGILAATAPELASAGCTAHDVTLYGKLAIDAERPEFAGPLRLGSLACPKLDLVLAKSALQLDGKLDRAFDGLEGKASLAGGALVVGGNRLGKADGTGQFAWRGGALTADYDLAFGSVSTPQALLDSLGAKGAIRAKEGFSRIELEADLAGEGLTLGKGLEGQLAAAADSSAATLAGPMLEKIRGVLKREGRASQLAASLTVRKTGDVWSLVIPQANLRGTSGASLLAVSRFQLGLDAAGTPRFSGNFATGGAGLPQIAGRMESRAGSGAAEFRMHMAQYRVGDGSLALPELTIAQAPGGALSFTGRAEASGPIPGGLARGLKLPIAGTWSPKAGLAMWRSCTQVRFDRLELSSLALDGRSLTLCPPTGRAILASDGAGTRFAAGTPALELTGTLGGSQLSLASGAVGFAWPGNFTASNVDVALGPADSATRFRLSEIDGALDSAITGHFSGTDAKIFAVPLDILDAAGDWTYADGRLSLTGGTFRLEDREQVDRFEPLVARDANLTLADNVVTANALMRDAKSDRAVTRADIVHDLNTATGHADLSVDALVFDKSFQPDQLTPYALGVVANAFGTVTGKGRIDWNPDNVTSSGTFSTRDFDFAAAFGPVKGVSGTINFTDLLGFVTAPDQTLDIQEFNPGIEVDRGTLTYQLEPDFVMVIKGGSWPFLGGRLVLEPTRTQLTAREARRYTLRLEGVSAARFVQDMDLANLAATGTFDGRVPLVFDEQGGHIVGGVLRSRPPGGNLSYVGDLTYMDLSTMANFAFDALRSLDFGAMEVTLDGPLTGEIVTQVKIDGVKQGKAARRNFITRQLAGLPIRFNVNIHAPFYSLITTGKMMYDPATIRDPRDLGLLDAQGRPIKHPAAPRQDVAKPKDLPPAESGIQTPESETAP